MARPVKTPVVPVVTCHECARRAQYLEMLHMLQTLRAMRASDWAPPGGFIIRRPFSSSSRRGAALRSLAGQDVTGNPEFLIARKLP